MFNKQSSEGAISNDLYFNKQSSEGAISNDLYNQLERRHIYILHFKTWI